MNAREDIPYPNIYKIKRFYTACIYINSITATDCLYKVLYRTFKICQIYFFQALKDMQRKIFHNLLFTFPTNRYIIIGVY